MSYDLRKTRASLVRNYARLEFCEGKTLHVHVQC